MFANLCCCSNISTNDKIMGASLKSAKHMGETDQKHTSFFLSLSSIKLAVPKTPYHHWRARVSPAVAPTGLRRRLR